MKGKKIYALTTLLFVVGLISSLVIGKYPLSFTSLLNGDITEINIFVNLRLARTIMAVLAGFALSITGFVYQTVMKNPIASPDIIGVSSGASVGAGVAIVFLGASTTATMVSAFIGGVIAVLLSITIASLSKQERIATFVLSGIAVNAVAEALLMLIKMTADPTGQLAALEFWTMGSFAAITVRKITPILPIVTCSIILLFLLYRQITLLSLDVSEAKMLGVSVRKMRIVVVITATLAVSLVVATIGKITFIGLIAPHLMRLMTKSHSLKTMLFSGVLGSAIILIADCLARSIGNAEIPISILTSVIGAPMLITMVIGGGRVE